MNGAALTLTLVVAAVAGLRGTWSPCGLSMISAINPMSERSRGHRFWVTGLWFVTGALGGGAALGAGAAALGAGVHAVVGSDRTLLWIAALAALIAVAADLGVAGFRLPTHPRQVNERWLGRYRRWIYATGFGAQIGIGFATYIMTAGTYLVVVLGALSPSWVTALMTGLTFAGVRGAAVFLSGRAGSAAALMRLHRRLAALEPWSLRLVVAVDLLAAAAFARSGAGAIAALAIVVAGLAMVVVSTGRPSRRPVAVLAAVLLVAGVVAVALPGTRPAGAAVTTNATRAVQYANQNGYRSAIGVLDTQTGTFWGAGDYNSVYASESVMKVFIATRLLMTGQMSGWNQTTAYKMITQSDDASANALYGRAGGDQVITWVKQALRIPNLGAPPPRAGWWGGTQINARGMAAFYQAVRHRADVWPWLSQAMHAATQYGSDGTYQFFGIPSATPGPAIKQGWGADNGAGQPAFNSTGLVNSDRYAVVILTQGGVYGAPIAAMLTAQARMLMPSGRIPNDSPDGTIESAGVYGNHVSLRGWSYDPNLPASAVKIVVYVNGRIAAYGPTNVARPDVNAAYRITGSHGYAFGLTLPDGANSVCVYATNLGAGLNSTLGCRMIPIDGRPVGVLNAPSLLGNVMTASGWTYDYDSPAAPVKTVLYVDGRLVAYGPTTVTVPAVNAGYQISGAHGYTFRVPLADGAHTVCAYATNVGPGSNSLLGCRVVGVTGSPLGNIDGLTISHGVATVHGWTYDYDLPSASIKAVAYLNGSLVAYGLTTVDRPDVNTFYGIAGNHGFSFSFAVPSGGVQVCVYGTNYGIGLNTLVGCRVATG